MDEPRVAFVRGASNAAALEKWSPGNENTCCSIIETRIDLYNAPMRGFRIMSESSLTGAHASDLIS